MLHQRLSQSAPPEQSPSLASDLLISARPKQWIKNGFVFAALIFASKVGHPDLVLRTVSAFLLFSLVSAGIYLLNDTVDRDADRQHPLKAHRPIAAGRVPVRLAAGLSAGAILGGLALSAVLDHRLGLIIAAYSVLSITYTFYLKHLVLIDVFAIAGGFVLRAAGGAAVIHVSISPWLYLCTILLSLLLGFGKRRHELLVLEEGAAIHRRNLEEYTGPLLDDLINIVAGATIIAYSLYTFTPFASSAPHNHAMMITIPFVLYGVFRYLLLVHRTDFAGAPEEAVWKDRLLLADLALWVAASAIILHFYRT
jgi:4-hydroxybenzoate polyprenyltransferase